MESYDGESPLRFVLTDDSNLYDDESSDGVEVEVLPSLLFLKAEVAPGRKRRSSATKDAIMNTWKSAGKLGNRMMVAAEQVAKQAGDQVKSVFTLPDGRVSPLPTRRASRMIEVPDLAQQFENILKDSDFSHQECELALRQALFKLGKLESIPKEVSKNPSETRFFQMGKAPQVTRKQISTEVARVTSGPKSPKSPSIRRKKLLSDPGISPQRELSAKGRSSDPTETEILNLKREYNFEIRVVEARNLQTSSANRNATVDAVAKVNLVNSSGTEMLLGKTDKVLRSLDPEWNCTFVTDVISDDPNFVVVLEVFNMGRMVGNSSLGKIDFKVVLSPSETCEGYATDSWLMLEGNGIVSGEVRIQVAVILAAVGRGQWDFESKLCRVASKVAEFDRNGGVVAEKMRREFLHFLSLLECREMRQLAAWGEQLGSVTKVADMNDEFLLMLKSSRLLWLGIPRSRRAPLYMAGLKVDSRKEGYDPGYYNKLCKTTAGMDCAIFSQIEADVPRTASGKKSFAATASGKAMMTRVLKTYALRNEILGYCQSLTYIVEALMLVTLDEEELFWCLVSICEDQEFCAGYFVPTMSHYKADFNYLKLALQQHLPSLTHLLLEDDSDQALAMIASSWFLCIFTTSFPSETAMRFMDMFIFYGGSAMIIAISVAMIELHTTDLLETCEDAFDIAKALELFAQTCFDPDEIILATEAYLSKNSIESIQRGLDVERAKQNVHTLSNVKAKAVEKLESYGGYTHDLVLRFIESFFEDASLDDAHADLPVDYLGINCEQFCNIINREFPKSAHSGIALALSVKIVPLFENLDWSRDDCMRLKNYLSALAFVRGPKPGSTEEEALDYLFRCFDLDNTHTLDKVEFGRMETALKTFSNVNITTPSHKFFESYRSLELETFVQGAPGWLRKRCFTWMQETTSRYSSEDETLTF
eukprot:m.203892 g.203892  ORF g.203892 m.203892 type:complete len:933 (+) comp32868_c0_seq1:357-3155(+)